MRVTGRTTDLFLCKNADPRHGFRPRGLVSHCAPADRHCLQKSTWTRCPEHHCMQLTSEIAPSWSGQKPFVFQTIYPSKAPAHLFVRQSSQRPSLFPLLSSSETKANLRTPFFISIRLVLFWWIKKRVFSDVWHVYGFVDDYLGVRSKQDTSSIERRKNTREHAECSVKY